MKSKQIDFSHATISINISNLLIFIIYLFI